MAVMEGSKMAKNLIATIQVNLVPRASGTNSPELLLYIKSLVINLPSQPFLAATLDFTYFFTRATPFCTVLLFWYSFCICILQSQPLAGFGASFTCLLSLGGRDLELNFCLWIFTVQYLFILKLKLNKIIT